jgi:L-threonylcarbamoyladenylate synthase
MEIITDINSNINRIIKHMNTGNPIIIPTDTNYNFACFPSSIEAIDKISKYKERPKNKPLSLFFLNPNDWGKYGICKEAHIMNRLIEAFWPGPLNIIINKKNTYFNYMINNIDSIALGCISNPTWRKFMSFLNDKPIAITSANISGTANDMLVTKEIAITQFENRVKYFIESEIENTTSKSSTIILITSNSVKILREGDLTKRMLTTVLATEGFNVE